MSDDSFTVVHDGDSVGMLARGNRLFRIQERVGDGWEHPAGAEELLNGIRQLQECARQAPQIHAIFETHTPINSKMSITGSTTARIKRIEKQDDGSWTVVIDYWPETPAVTREEAEKFLVEYHAAIWEAAEGGKIAYDEAGEKIAEDFLAKFGAAQ